MKTNRPGQRAKNQSAINTPEDKPVSIANSRPKPRTTEKTNINLEQESGYGKIFGNKPAKYAKPKTRTKVNIGKMISKSRKYSPETGKRSSFNLLEVLERNRKRKPVYNNSKFDWSALWRYLQTTYNTAPSAARNSVSTPTGPAQIRAITTELAFLFLLIVNVVLWVMTYLSFRKTRPKTEHDNFNSRLQYIIAD